MAVCPCGFESHLRYMRKVEYDLELLHKQIYEDKLPYDKIGALYGVTGAAIVKKAKSLGWQLPNRRFVNDFEIEKRRNRPLIQRYCKECGKLLNQEAAWNNIFCCLECSSKFRHKQLYAKLVVGDPSIMRSNYNPNKFREDIISEQEGKCAICGMPQEWQGKPLVFIVDHIDGHASNNIRSNLRCICPNCDSQLDTYKNKNAKSDRVYYRMNQRR